MKVIFAFFLGLFLGIAGGSGYLFFLKPPESKVLAEKIETTPSPLKQSLPPSTPSPSPSPSPSLSPSPSPKPTVKAASTVAPSPRPSARLTSSPSPSPVPSPRASVSPSPSPTPSLSPSPTPISSPTATPVVLAPAAMEPFFVQYAAQYNVDKNILVKIADCESQFDPLAISRNGLYVGLFQFSSGTWISNRGWMDLDPNLSLRTHVEESIKTAAFLLSRSGTSPWSSCD